MSRLKKQIAYLETVCNGIELVGVLLVLIMALGVQFFWHEEPCPLCMLQRAGFIMVALGFTMNLRFGLQPKHYAWIILSALFSGIVALIQIAMNLDNPQGGMGTPILGLHLYTWTFIISFVIITVTTLIMTLELDYKPLDFRKSKMQWLLKITLILIALIICANIFTACKHILA